jgi:hypothetical protein
VLISTQTILSSVLIEDTGMLWRKACHPGS